MINTAPVITIDGLSGTGKSTLSQAIAKILNWNILDSGVIYRTLALAAQYQHVDISSESELYKLAVHLNATFIYTNNNFTAILEGKNVTSKIRVQEISNIASKIAIFSRVREALLDHQRMFRTFPGLIADGRDMGTVIFPDAPVKIFLDASLKERAYRRMLQLKKNGFNVSFRCLLSEIKERDDRDANRTVSPIFPAKDALVLNSTSLIIEQVITKALQYIRKKLAF